MRWFGLVLVIFFLSQNSRQVLAIEKKSGEDFSTTISGEQGHVTTELNIPQQPVAQSSPEPSLPRNSKIDNIEKVIENQESSIALSATPAPILNNQTNNTLIPSSESANYPIPEQDTHNYYQDLRISQYLAIFLIFESLAGCLLGLGLINFNIFSWFNLKKD